MTARLDLLRILEVSGVDEPANQIPGWVVMKSATGDLTHTKEQLLHLRDVLTSVISKGRADTPDEAAVLGVFLRHGAEREWRAGIAAVPAEKRRAVIIKAAELLDGERIVFTKRHAVRHPETGRYTEHPVPKPQPGLFKRTTPSVHTGGAVLTGGRFFS